MSMAWNGGEGDTPWKIRNSGTDPPQGPIASGGRPVQPSVKCVED